VVGGDGSLAVVAAVATEHGIAFACIPAGTRNHFASNNPHALDNPLAPGTGTALDTGRLGIVFLGVPGDTSLRSGRAWTAPYLEVSAPVAAHAGLPSSRPAVTPGHPARNRT
jgi:hypothetical protein